MRFAALHASCFSLGAGLAGFGTVRTMLERLPIDAADPEDSFAATRALSSDERLAWSFRLWDDGCRMYADVHGVSIEEAATRLSAHRQIGRIPLFDEPSLTP